MSRSFIDYKLFSILTSASRSPSAIAELFVIRIRPIISTLSKGKCHRTVIKDWGCMNSRRRGSDVDFPSSSSTSSSVAATDAISRQDSLTFDDLRSTLSTLQGPPQRSVEVTSVCGRRSAGRSLSPSDVERFSRRRLVAASGWTGVTTWALSRDVLSASVASWWGSSLATNWDASATFRLANPSPPSPYTNDRQGSTK